MSEEGEAKEGLALKADELNTLPCPSNSELTVSVCYIVIYQSVTSTVYGVFFTPLNFHEFRELFWICEIKFNVVKMVQLYS